MSVFNLTLGDIDQTFNAKCNVGSSGCRGRHYQLDRDASTKASSYLVVHEEILRLGLFGQYLSIDDGVVYGRTLATRYSVGTRVKYEILRPENFRSYNWQVPRDRNSFKCSGKMEKSITTTINSHIFMETPVQAMYTSGMFQIFQQASQFDSFSSPGGPSLEFLGNEPQITVVASLSKTESIVGLCVSVVFPLLCVYLLLDRHARILLWSMGQLQHCNVLIRALADSDMFPPSCVDLLVKHVGIGRKGCVCVTQSSMQWNLM